MVAKILGGGGQGKPLLQIIPDNDVILLQGHRSEAPPATVTGKLVLDTPDDINVKTIKIKLEGVQKIAYGTMPSTRLAEQTEWAIYAETQQLCPVERRQWTLRAHLQVYPKSSKRLNSGLHTAQKWLSVWLPNIPAPSMIQDKETFLRDERILYPTDGGKGKPHKLGAGHKEWTFEFSIPGEAPESVEGLANSYIIYNMTASVSTAGFMTRDLVAKSHIRVVRTLSFDALDAGPMEQINEDVWTNKVSYKVALPRINYTFGTSVTATITLTPIRKGLEIGTVRMALWEQCKLGIDKGETVQTHEWEKKVTQLEQEMPENARQEHSELDPNNPVDESYHFSMTLPLPKSLNRCRQSADTGQIQINHKLITHINLKNPEGHISQLVVKNPLNLFISPNYHIGEDQCIQIDANQQTEEAMNNASNQVAPPGYGQHHFDQLWDNIDPSGYMTPGARSGINTPFYSQSRNGSAENLPLPVLDALIQSPTSAPHGGPAASALHSRLATLQDRGSSHSARTQGQGQSQPTHSPSEAPFEQPSDANWSHFTPPSLSGSSSRQSHSGGPSRRTSDEQPPPIAPQRLLGYDMEALARIPSYSTALRTPVSSSPKAEGLPTYEAATSRPPSPNPTGTRIPIRTSGESSGERDPPESDRESRAALRDTTARNTASNAATPTLQVPPAAHPRR
ncbi:hypothetical protein H2201_002573 [Coniosporium apollinis]|uniref:Arrestin C-terminal-like domain-containing protein n=1 Tax=Coniosporium apollinis TaxID=61459 RepID=A0ABQ9P4S0_9PEZI|nr:hypothetical protein H2201_002573 [Coniosporium apollinis]